MEFRKSTSPQQAPTAARLPRDNGRILGPERRDLSNRKAVFVQGTGLCPMVGKKDRKKFPISSTH